MATLSTQLVSPTGPYHENFLPYTFKSNPQSPDVISPPERPRFTDEQFHEIIGELRILTAKAHKEELFNEIRSEWMFGKSAFFAIENKRG